MNTRKGKQWLCIDCGAPVNRRVKRCPECHQKFLRNKPTYERTPEHRAKMSERLKGVQHNWRTGKPPSCQPEVADKIREWWTPERREEWRENAKERAMNQAWRDLIARAVSGELNPNYQGKDKATPYAPGFGRLHRRLIRERAGNRCEICGKEGRLDIHHKDFSKDNHHPDNLMAVCRACHKSLHNTSPRN